MSFDDEINIRLDSMSRLDDPSDVLWPEKCGGSRNALVVFIGPSPGGKKELQRRKRDLGVVQPLWNTSFDDPLTWSRGFKESFKHIVESIFEYPYQVSGKLIALLNMDWMQNPESTDVSYRYMWEGCAHIISILQQCDPKLVIPMDEKTFGVLQMSLFNSGFDIFPVKTGNIEIRISDNKKKPRYHRGIKAFIAKKGRTSLVIIKSFQHPARIYDEDYAKRVGQGIKQAFNQIVNGEEVKLLYT